MTPLRLLLAAVSLAGCASAAHALRPSEMTSEELSALPRWCSYTQTFDQSADAPGHYNDHVARYGSGWTHVHHYCWALGSMLRYSQTGTTAGMKQTLVALAIQDLDYVLRRVPEDFVLRREIMMRKARILIVDGSAREGLKTAEQVAASWPDEADSHGLMAEALLALNHRDAARKVLDQALSKVRDKDRLAKIRTALKL